MVLTVLILALFGLFVIGLALSRAMDNPINRGDEPLGNPADVEEGEPIPEDEPEPDEPDPFEERAVLPKGWRPRHRA